MVAAQVSTAAATKASSAVLPPTRRKVVITAELDYEEENSSGNGEILTKNINDDRSTTRAIKRMSGESSFICIDEHVSVRGENSNFTLLSLFARDVIYSRMGDADNNVNDDDVTKKFAPSSNVAAAVPVQEQQQEEKEREDVDEETVAAAEEEEESVNLSSHAPQVLSHRSRQWTTVSSQTLLGAEVEKIEGQVLQYQWRRNGVDVPGATSALYVISPVRLEDAGTYTCAVTDSKSKQMAIWEEVMLHVNSPPEVEAEFRRIKVHAGSKFTLAVPFVMANPAPTFQWRLNGVDIPGGTGQQYDIESASVDDVGTYTCELTNIAGKAIFEEYLVSFY